MVVQTGTFHGVMQPAQYQKWIETWSLQFTWAGSAGPGTQVFAVISRTPGSAASIFLATSSTPFYLPPSQSGVIVDAYINGPTVAGLNGSAYLNFFINDQDQRLAIDLASYNATIAGRKAIVAKALPAGCQFRASCINQNAVSSTGATQLVLLDVEIFQQ